MNADALLRKIALSLPQTTENPHFEKISFRVNKKIFVTYDSTLNRACFKFSAQDQDVFTTSFKKVVYPVPNKWGQLGWTYVEMMILPLPALKAMLIAAYCEVAPKKVSEQILRKHK